MTQGQLTQAAIVPRRVVEDFEAGAGAENPVHLEAIRTALEAAGVEFTNDATMPGPPPQTCRSQRQAGVAIRPL